MKIKEIMRCTKQNCIIHKAFKNIKKYTFILWQYYVINNLWPDASIMAAYAAIILATLMSTRTLVPGM